MPAIESEKPTHIITSNNLKNFYVVNAFNKEKYFLSSFLVMNDNNLIKLNQLSTNFNNKYIGKGSLQHITFLQ